MRTRSGLLAAGSGPRLPATLLFLLEMAFLYRPVSPAAAAALETADVPAVPATTTLPAPAGGAPAAEYLGIPPESQLYDDLEHFRALGLWRGSMEMRPMRRDDFRRAVAAVRSAASANPLSARDELRLRMMEKYLLPWAVRRTRAVGADGEPPARAELSAALRFVGTATGLDSLANLDRRSRREQFFILSADAAIGSHLVAQWRFYEDYDQLTPLQPGDHWVDNLPPRPRQVLTSPSARNDRAVLGVGWRWGQVRIGREDRRWGCGREGTLFLSENPFPLDGVSAAVDTRYVGATSLLAQLRRGNSQQVQGGADGDTAAVMSTGDSWLAAHRIELRPRKNLRLGLYEAAVWTGRGIDLAYANPVSFILAVTQDLYDRAGVDDKKVLGFDLAADIAPVSFYGEVLLNRIVTLDASDGPESQASTWAQLVGLRWAGPLGLDGADLDLEYAHLDPEVYFHKDNDPGRALLTEGELVGHWLGPNSDSFHAALEMPIGMQFGHAALMFERSRWGVIDGLRGTDLGFIGLTKEEKRWITGLVEEERIYSARWRRDALRWPARLLLDAEARLAWVDRSGMRTPDGWQAELRLTLRAPYQLGE
jgi:hypothetical protein